MKLSHKIFLVKNTFLLTSILRGCKLHSKTLVGIKQRNSGIKAFLPMGQVSGRLSQSSGLTYLWLWMSACVADVSVPCELGSFYCSLIIRHLMRQLRVK
jgi:hypothetical protein